MLNEQLARATEIIATDHINVIPELAAMQRKATGWVRTILFGLLGILIGLAWLLLEIVFVSFVLRQVLPIALDFALTLPPFEWNSGETFFSGYMYALMQGAGLADLERLTPKGEAWHWIVLLAATLFTLYRSSGVREHLKGIERWPTDETPPWPVALPMHIVLGLIWAGLVIFIGGLVAMALMPLVRFGLMVSLLVEFVQVSWEEFAPVLREYWYYLAGGILVIALLVYRARKSLPELLKRLVILFSLLGFASMAWQIYDFSRGSWVYWTILALMCLYPIGLAIPLSRLLFPAYNTFRNALFNMYQRAALRMRLQRAVAYHRKRNREKTQGHIWKTVCKKDLVRFEPHTERLAYSGWMTYGCCPICDDDHEVYNEVGCLALSVDEEMQDKVRQKGAVLSLNSLDWLNGPEDAAAPVFDAIVIGKAKKHMVEGLVVRYNSRTLTGRHRPLKEIPVHLAKDSELDQNTLRILGDNCGPVTKGDSPAEAIRPVENNLEVRDNLRKQGRRFWRAFQRVGITILVMLLVLGGLAALYFLVPSATDLFSEWIERAVEIWNTIRYDLIEPLLP